MPLSSARRRSPDLPEPRANSGSGSDARPFVKWAGGKGQLIAQLDSLFPSALKEGRIRTYVEPFVGGGALFFHVMQRYRIERAYLFDINEEICLAYTAIKRDASKLIRELEKLQDWFLPLSEFRREKLYYKIRDEYNAARSSIDRRSFSQAWTLRAAQLIFMNRTCYNGLFRTNSKGGFNTPFGRYAFPTIADVGNIRAVSSLLKSAQIRHGDFECCEEFVDTSSFVYFDPPYRPISRTASFNAYSRDGFSDAEQERLCAFYRKLDSESGAKLMLSNSDPKNVNPRDDFFEALYRGYSIARIGASRMINSKAEKRGKIRELVITNY